jgi:hypothetical protein
VLYANGWPIIPGFIENAPTEEIATVHEKHINDRAEEPSRIDCFFASYRIAHIAYADQSSLYIVLPGHTTFVYSG